MADKVGRPLLKATRAECPISEPMVELLQACLLLGTVKTSVLKTHLNLSYHGVESRFKRACRLVNVPGRTELLLKAIHEGWVAQHTRGIEKHTLDQ